MRILLSLFMITRFQETQSLPRGLGEWYNLIQDFTDTLHTVLQEGAKTVDTYDAVGAQVIRDFEYNWLSVFGYYKGLLPLVSDFYFHYYKNASFTARNSKFVRTLRSLISLFVNDASEDAICQELEALVSDSLNDHLFKEGSILEFLTDFNRIVEAKPNCLNLIRHAKSNGGEIALFLQFILKGAPKAGDKKPYNSEL